MSEKVAAEGGEERKRRTRVRRRGPRKEAKEGEAPKATRVPKAAAAEAAPRVRTPRVIVPVPAELFGKVSQGQIADVINGGRGKYGFINIGAGEATETTPRVYFNFTEFTDAEFTARRGYAVEFTVNKDETERAFASNIRLTVDGRAQAAEREARIAAEKTREPRKPAAEAAPAGAASEGATGEKKKRERTARVRPEDDRSVTLRVTCVGFTDVKIVVAKLSQSIGKLKHAATEAFEAPIALKLFHNNALLTKAVLRSLSDNDTVNLKEEEATA